MDLIDPRKQMAQLLEEAEALSVKFSEVHGGLVNLLHQAKIDSEEAAGPAHETSSAVMVGAELSAANEKIRDLEAKLTEQAETLAALQAEDARRAASLQLRFNELATLTAMLEDIRLSPSGDDGQSVSASSPQSTPARGSGVSDQGEDATRLAGNPDGTPLKPEQGSSATSQAKAKVSSAKASKSEREKGSKGGKQDGTKKSPKPEAQGTIALAASLPAQDESASGAVWHMCDLRTDSLLATVVLNHVLIERSGGVPARVWNAFGVEAVGFNWQIRRLILTDAGALSDATPSANSVLFVYGLQVLREILEAKPLSGLRLRVVVGQKQERDEAAELLQRAGLSGEVFVLDRRMFSIQDAALRSDSWPAALHVGLFTDQKAKLQPPIERVGLSLQGRRPTQRDEDLITYVREGLSHPLIVLAPEEERERLLQLGAEVVTIDRSRDFYKDFFRRIGTLVDWPARLDEMQITSAAGQALQRERLAAVLTSENYLLPGVSTFQDRNDLLVFLQEVTSSPDRYERAREKSMLDVSDALGHGFHLGRLGYATKSRAAVLRDQQAGE
ncbi:hypothetical protein [Roseomonas indoligenes]|uniref:Uncharacterized protein n=1 Tax=Roseomonas indoligenes TaxID=2820811 RepID=A0A940N1L4_9PROT|nr:hypothetical protein [Pararoseomonas indoligenes]MBP0496281.1 hypothetical protein [Pararoseomonas indoligenes]